MKLRYLFSLLAVTASLHAGADTSKTTPPMSTAPAESGWHFRMAPYGWVTAINGDVRIGQLSAPVDISMSDTLESLDMAYMGFMEASYGKWAFGVDTIYGKTSQDIGGGGLLFRSFRYEQKQWIITPTIAYRVIETANYHMDIFAGVRITSLEADLTGRFVGGGQTRVGRDTAWVDPIIGIRGQGALGDAWFFRYNGDIGGFGAGSDFAWQAFAGIGYKCSSSASLVLGYRALGVDYDKESFAMNTISHGPVIGLEIHF